jgi:plasmid stabilization system protein ParE
MEVLLHQKAIADLADIWTITQQSMGKDQADGLYTPLITAMKSLPLTPSKAVSLEYVKDGYRMLRLHEYGLFYRADLDDQIEVVRVLAIGS